MHWHLPSIIEQMRMVFEMMGFTFSENQVLALFSRYDTDLTGEQRRVISDHHALAPCGQDH